MSAAVRNSFQEYDPRHRLIGVVVLVLLAIILLPMLLNKKPDDQIPAKDPVVMEIRKEGKKVFVSRISSTTSTGSTISTAAEKTAVKSSAAKDEKIEKIEKREDPEQAPPALFKPMSSTTAKKSSGEQSSVKKTISKPSSSTPSIAKKDKDTPKKPALQKSSTAIAAGGWIVQVGVFSQSENARNKVSELKKKGFNVKSSKIKTDKGLVTKVWIGPFKHRSSAEIMQDRLQYKTRQRGMVVESKPQ
jgi:DedD protein